MLGAGAARAGAQRKRQARLQYRTFGALDWRPSALGFGAMRLPVLPGDSGTASRTEQDRLPGGDGYAALGHRPRRQLRRHRLRLPRGAERGLAGPRARGRLPREGEGRHQAACLEGGEAGRLRPLPGRAARASAHGADRLLPAAQSRRGALGEGRRRTVCSTGARALSPTAASRTSASASTTTTTCSGASSTPAPACGASARSSTTTWTRTPRPAGAGWSMRPPRAWPSSSWSPSAAACWRARRRPRWRGSGSRRP